MDVLGYSLEEISGITGSTIASVKASLHRGRLRLSKAMAALEASPLPALSETERIRLSAYVDRFNARDFDAVKNLLADDVRLELVSRYRLNGRNEAERYFGNYAKMYDWEFRPGFVDLRPSVIASDPGDPARRPSFFVLLEWEKQQIRAIRDFRFARYAIEGAEIHFLN